MVHADATAAQLVAGGIGGAHALDLSSFGFATGAHGGALGVAEMPGDVESEEEAHQIAEAR